MKRKDGKSEVSERSWTLVNSLSKCSDEKSKLHDSENKLTLIISKEDGIKLNVTADEDSEPKKEDLQRLYDLLDGFKASKVVCVSLRNFYGKILACNIFYGISALCLVNLFTHCTV